MKRIAVILCAILFVISTSGLAFADTKMKKKSRLVVTFTSAQDKQIRLIKVGKLILKEEVRNRNKGSCFLRQE